MMLLFSPFPNLSYCFLLLFAIPLVIQLCLWRNMCRTKNVNNMASFIEIIFQFFESENVLVDLLLC